VALYFKNKLYIYKGNLLKREKFSYLIESIMLCYNNIGNLLPSRDTTILVKNMTTN